MASVHRCPVCMGKGIVPYGFYLSTTEYTPSTSTKPETCRSCDGRGVIVVHDQTPARASASDLRKIIDDAERGGVKR